MTLAQVIKKQNCISKYVNEQHNPERQKKA